MQRIPIVFPGEIDSLHVELFAAGDLILHVLHADLIRRLSTFALELLSMDTQCLGMWCYPLLPVLEERTAQKHLKRFLRQKTAKGMGLAALYAYHLGLDPKPYIEKSNPKGYFLYLLGRELARKIV